MKCRTSLAVTGHVKSESGGGGCTTPHECFHTFPEDSLPSMLLIDTLTPHKSYNNTKKPTFDRTHHVGP